MNYKTINDFDNLNNTAVLMRVDFNVPIKYGIVQDTTRIQAHLPTIEALTKKGAKVVLVSHLGRPKNQEPEFSLKPVADELEKLIDAPVSFCSSLEKDSINKAKSTLKAGDVLVLENIRFFEGETENDSFLASMLSENISVFVNDAFASSHRSHASVCAICNFVKQKAVGLLMEEELENLKNIEEYTKSSKKLAVIASGAKVSTKLSLLKNLAQSADDIFIAGAMANTFFAAQGKEVGTSLFESNMLDDAKEVVKFAAKSNCNIHLPEDLICAYELKEGTDYITANNDNIPASMMVLDVGSKTIQTWLEKLEYHDLILINGPLGVFEKQPFDNGTKELFTGLEYLDAKKIAGGGDTIFAIKKSETVESFDFISTGGGALLEALEGKTLPGVEAIMS